MFPGVKVEWCCRNPVRVSHADSMPRVSDSAALMRLAIATLLGCQSERQDIINHGILKVAVVITVVRNRGAYLLLAAQHVFLRYRRIIKECSRSYER